MALYEEAKGIFEKAFHVARPERAAAKALVRRRKPHAFLLRDDGETPNNPRFPLVLYRGPVKLVDDYDHAAIFEDLFDANGWRDGWRDGMYDYLHWHTVTHEVLGIARGTLEAEFGGSKGRRLRVKASDVLILPAGTGHRRLNKSRDLLVVGAYPARSDYDEQRPRDGEYNAAVKRIAKVRPPPSDPVYGKGGPLLGVWRDKPRRSR